MFFCFSVFLFFCFSCKNTSTENEFYELRSIAEYKLPAADNSNFYCVHPKIAEYKNKFILSFIDPLSRNIYIWDLEGKTLLDSIDIDFYKYQFVQQYHIIDSNEFILAFNPEYFELNHDKALIRTNRNKEILGAFNFTGANVPTSKQCIPDSLLSFVNYSSFPIFYNKNEKYVMASLCSYYRKYRALQLTDVTQYKLVGKVYEDSSKEFSPFNYHLTPPKIGLTNPVSYELTKAFIDTINQTIGVGHGNISEIQLFEISSENKLNSINLKSFFVESEIKPLKESEFDNYEEYLPEYANMVYNHTNNNLYRIVKLPLNDSVSPIFFSFPLHSIIEYCFDEKTQKEAILPFGFGAPIVSFKDGFLAYNQYLSKTQNTRCFSYFEFDKKKDFDRNTKKILKIIYAQNSPKSNEIGWNSYFEALCIDSDTVVSVNLNRICLSCKNKLGMALSNGIIKKNLPIILVANNDNYIQNFITKYKLNKDSFFIDNKNTQSFYIKQYVNPIVIINKGDSIVEEVINPSRMNYLIDSILNN